LNQVNHASWTQLLTEIVFTSSPGDNSGQVLGYSAMLPDSHTRYQPIRSLESVPRREMASGHRRNADVPVIGHPPPGLTRSAVTRVSQWSRPCSWQRIDRSGGWLQRWKASAERYASWQWWWSAWLVSIHSTGRLESGFTALV